MSQEKIAEIINLNAARDTAMHGAGAGETAGEHLARVRRTAGLGLVAVSTATKIKLAHLEAIEASTLEALPAMPYAVGFVKGYAKYLDLDADALAAHFKDEMAAKAPQPETEAREEYAGLAETNNRAFLAPLFGVFAVLVFVIWIFVQISGAKEGDMRNAEAAPAPRITLGAAPATTSEPRRIAAPAPLPEPAGPIEQPAAVEDAEILPPAGEEFSVGVSDVAPSSEAPDLAPVAAEVIAGEAPPAAVDTLQIAPDAPDPLPLDSIASETLIQETPLTQEPAFNDLNTAQIERILAPPMEEALAPPPVITPPAAPMVVAAQLSRSRAPKYPARCARDAQETEAVTLMFDVTAAGRVANARVVAATNACFEGAAIRALARWRFNPKTIDGAPRPDIGKQATLNFRR